MSPAVALAAAVEHMEASRLAPDSHARNALVDLAIKLVRSVLADYTPVMPLAARSEALRESSAHLKAVHAELEAGRVAAGLTPPKVSRATPPPLPRRTPRP